MANVPERAYEEWNTSVQDISNAIESSPFLNGQVPFDHEVNYLTRSIFSGRSRFLTVLPVPRYGHCNFTKDEILGAFGVMILKSYLQ